MNLKSQWLKTLLNKHRRSSPLNGRRCLSAETLEAKQLLVGDIAGTLLHDTNGNAVKDPGEEGLANWTVFLDLNNNSSLDAGEPSQQTNVGGDYLFLNLADGDYSVREVLPTGWAPTPGTSAVQTATVTDGNEFKANFFNVIAEVGDITGVVWRDFNGDGVRATDPGTGAFTDTALSGWTIYLDTNNNRTLDAGETTTLTDANGGYSFLGVASGSQYVGEVLQTGYEASRGFDFQVHVTVTTGHVTVVDFANLTPEASDVSGTVFNDIDGNGARGATEPGLGGWQVFVDKNEDGLLTPGELVTTSAADGSYTLVGVPRGRQMIAQVPDAHYRTNSPVGGAFTIDVLNGVMLTGYDFANEERIGNLSGVLWNDFNGDGVRALTDVALSGWTVFLDENHNGVADPTELSQTTDLNGQYTFVGLPEGTVTVAEVVPAGWEVAPGFSASVTTSISTGLTTTVDFANLQPVPSTINGAIYNDMNADGIRAKNPTTGVFTEPGLSGWQVFVDLNNDGLLTAGEPVATSDADGNYSLTGVPHGTRKIVEVANPNFIKTAPASGQYTVNVLNGVTIGGYDFGNQERSDATIRGAVYVDSNHNGVRDAGERGLSGVTVFLDLNDDGVLETGEPSLVTSVDLYYTPGTDEAGAYAFTHLAGGTYKLREIVPVELSQTPVSEAEHLVTIGGAEAKTVDAGNVFRPNEIHGVKFDDANGNHVRDAGEAGIGGTTIYIDLDRDNVFDAGEPSTVTAADGSYSFTNLTPDAYVLRELGQAGYEQTYPTTTDGTLLPSGTSHPASGNVTPTSITGSLAAGATLRQTVSLTLPSSGGVTNLADVFLLFDDTGSFTANSPIVRAAFPQIISTLTTALPGIDFGFGVGRFEEYANFASEYSTGRPFVLNSPIIASSTTGFSTAIQAALDRTTPGYGGDQPETDIEALFQLVTGLGFDGNNNGTFTDSGAAGLVSTQLNPGSSGDVPAFSSYTVDPTGSGLPAAGSLGGAGFRAGALPIVLLATDTGFAYQPKGETSITGLNGVTIPVADIVHTTRTTTPFNYGAGIQETITGLNALGALVVGLGTNADLVSDPRADMAALARLTGAINNSTSTIANGTATPIAPGDPLYFQISSGFGTSVANGITNAIQNAVTNVAVNMTIKASDPRVHIINHTGTVPNIGAGQTATFDVEFTGDGRPYRFDLQFIREGTNVVLGSIPVVLGTPIPGNGYEFEDLVEGQIGQNIDFGSRSLSGLPVNVAPSFVSGANQSVLEDAGAQTVTAWATSISGGPASESAQTVNFVVSNNNASLFSVAPAIAADGTLTYTPAANANGSATVTVSLHDNGGTAGGGTDTSPSQTFTITVTAVNDAPVANDGSLTTNEDTATTGTLSATDIDSAALTFSLDSVANAHGSVTITDAATGAFSYMPDANYNGTASFTFTASDGSLVSNIGTVTITVNAVNDAPIASDGSLTTDEDIAKTGMLSASDIDSPTLTFSLGNVANAHGLVTITDASTGAFSYTPETNYNGSASFTFSSSDGSLASNISTVTITVNAVNDAPVANDGSLTTNEDTATTGTLSATDIDSTALTFSLDSTANAHGSVTITDTTTGAFSYTPDKDFNGSASFAFSASDGSLVSNLGTVTITVNAVNDAPIASDGSLTTNEDTTQTGTLLAADLDSATLTFSLVSTTNAHGSLTITNNATGAFSYTPDANFNGLASFTFLATDGMLISNIGTVTMTVNAVNDAPIASDGSLTTIEDTATTGTVVASDIDSAALTFNLVSTTNARGTVTITDANTGAFSYKPDANFNGLASFTFSASDGSLVSNIGTVTMTVNAVNDAPIASNGSLNTNEDVATTGTLSATDIDSAALTFSLVSTANAHGTVTITNTATGAFSYTPDEDFNGSASFTFLASDGTLDSNVGTVAITVNPVNDTVFASDGSLTTNEDTATTGTLLASDIDGSVLAYSLFSTTNAHGSVTITNNTTGAFRYTPDTNFSGSASFTFLANDGTVVSNIGTVTITVNAVNDAPSFTKGADRTGSLSGVAQTASHWASGISAGPADEAGQLVNFLVNTNNDALFSVLPAISADGTLTYTLVNNTAGSATVSVRLHDNGGIADGGVATSDPQTFVISAVNRAPSFVKGANQSVLEDAGAKSIAGWATSINAGPNELTQVVDFFVTTNNNGLFSELPAISATGTLTFTTAPNANGSAIVTVRAHDNGGTTNGGVDTSAPQTFTITVQAVNDLPTISAIADITTNEDISTGAIAVTIGDVETTATNLVLSATSSNISLIPNANILLGGSGANRTITLNPAANQSGTSTITLRVRDGNGAITSETFVVTVNTVNDSPTISNVANQTIDEDKSTSVINFTIRDVDNLAGSLVVTATSSNLDLVPNSNIVLGGSGSNRTIKVTPLPNQFGATTITLTVTDPSGASSSDTFLLTVRSVNDAPVVVPVTFSVSENTTNGTLVGTVSATDIDVGDTVTAFAITAGNLGNAFAIDIAGNITVKDATKIDFEAKPSYTLTVKATDNHGASGLGTVTVTVGNVTFNPIVTLGDTANSVVVSRVGSTLVVRSGAVNLTAPARLEDVGVLTIIGGAAADSVTLDASLNATGGVTTNRFTGSVVFQGNGGDDVLDAHNVNAAIEVNFSGGEGNDIAMGGAGNDTLDGGDGRDLLIGGAGVDVVSGGEGEDILIGGTSTLSGNSAALNAVMAEWTDLTKSYADRVLHLSNGGVGSANGTTRLNRLTVRNDSNAADSLNGNADLDWFFQSANDVLDAIVGEIRTAI